MIVGLARWIKAAWRSAEQTALIESYASLRERKILLADIALRGGLYSADGQDKTIYAAGVAEGRRQMALEILRLSDVNPEALRAMIAGLGAKQ